MIAWLSPCLKNMEQEGDLCVSQTEARDLRRQEHTGSQPRVQSLEGLESRMEEELEGPSRDTEEISFFWLSSAAPLAV